MRFDMNHPALCCSSGVRLPWGVPVRGAAWFCPCPCQTGASHPVQLGWSQPVGNLVSAERTHVDSQGPFTGLSVQLPRHFASGTRRLRPAIGWFSSRTRCSERASVYVRSSALSRHVYSLAAGKSVTIDGYPDAPGSPRPKVARPGPSRMASSSPEPWMSTARPTYATRNWNGRSILD